MTLVENKQPENEKPPRLKKTGGARSLARLNAVQALYQMEMADAAPERIIKEFIEHRLGREVEGDTYGTADVEFFTDIVKGVAANQAAIDTMISENLADDWSFERIDNILKCIARAGLFELIHRPDVPTKVIINEYLDVAHAFYGQTEPAFVNGILDRLARKIRA
jgi:N utilization substance protein B